MNGFFQESLFAGVTLSLIAYFAGTVLKKKFKLGIFNPLLISIAFTIIVLVCAGVDYDTYNAGAKYLSWFLTPATVCLAIPLYEKLSYLKKYPLAVFGGILSGTVACLGSVLGLSVAFGLTHEQYVTMLPKSITTAIGMGLSEELGGLAPVTVAVIILTGIFGNVAAEFIFRLFRIKDPVAQGLACGTGAHAMGTSRASELGEVQEAMSGLSIAVCGLLTVVLASLFSMINF